MLARVRIVHNRSFAILTPGMPASISLRIHLGFVGLYIALDAASFIHPLHGLNITPWNPAPALGLVFLLRCGRTGWPTLLATILLADCLIRGVPLSWWSSLVSALLLGGCYIAFGETLRRRLPPNGLFDDRSALMRWILLIGVGSLLVSLLYLGSLHLLGLLPGTGWPAGTLQFWIGDGVGITVAMPLFFWLSSDPGRKRLRTALLQWETLAYALLSLLSLWLAFGIGDDSGFKLFYLLFLPLVWASTRQGMAGAIISASLLQIEVIAAMQILNYSAVSVIEVQMLSLAMALVGFFIGCVVDEQQRTSEELKHSLRLAAAGEMAGALAHELNQPLTALAAYAAACEMLLERGESGTRLETAIQGMLRESARTGEVVRRLRDFFRTGATQLENIELAELVDQASQHYRQKAGQLAIDFELAPIPDIRLFADRLQLELVLRNLLANAFDAVDQRATGARSVRLYTEVLQAGRIGIVVEDSGPGLAGLSSSRIFEPFASSKSSGLGLGLAISRAIVEAHDGKLWCEATDHGLFKMTLPIQENAA